ncbi:hypothetical protein ACQPYK_12935 [Streptosporangium sp. CA-135522]|uniref:hypothetical protein n=1 Tax=Streptosporangium sp. CA-135522 TaxID=3240072 RepID=UPI003D8E6158
MSYVELVTKYPRAAGAAFAVADSALIIMMVVDRPVTRRQGQGGAGVSAGL